MRIVLIGPAYPLRGGIANFNESLAQALMSAGHEVSLISFTLQYPAFLFPGKTQYDITGHPPEGLNIKQKIHSLNPMTWFRTSRLIIEQNPDLVIVRFWIPFLAPALGTIAGRLKKAGLRVLAITDNVIPHEHRPGDKALTRYFCRRVNGFVAMSRSVLEDISRFTDNPLRTFLPHPVYDIFGEAVSKEKARQHLNLGTEDKIILFFGLIRRYKGLDLLLRAMADNRVQSLGVKLVIAGEFYENKEDYMNLIQKLNLSKNLHIVDQYIPGEDVRYYFCASDMVVQPYTSATQSGITQVAYNFGRPMLVTDVGGLSEIVADGKAGYVCTTRAEDIAVAIEDFYVHNREEEFSKNVTERKSEFSWQNFVRGLLALAGRITPGN